MFVTNDSQKINAVYSTKPKMIMLYIKLRLLLSIILDKNSIEKAQANPPITIAMVYSMVVTLTTFVAYVGKIGTSAETAAPWSKIPGNNTRCRFITLII